METKLALVGGLVAALMGVLTVVLAVRMVLRNRGDARTPIDLVAGRPPFESGLDGPALLRRLRISGLVQRASGVVTWRVGQRYAVAARTNGRGWATTRADGWSTRSTVSGPAYTLVAVTLPGALPTINVVRDGVLGSNVDVESGAFNESRDIRTDDDRIAHAVLTPRVIAMLQDLPNDLSVQIIGDNIVSFRRGVPRAEEVLQRADLLAEIADAIPDFVYDTAGR